MPPHRGLDAVGGDQKIGSNFAAVVETREGMLLVLLDRDQRAAVAIDIFGRQTQALPDAIPRCQHLRTRDLADHIATPRQHDAAFDGDADLAVLLGHESERFVQVVVSGDAGAARAEFLAGALVDRYVPADLAKEQPREQTANPSPDDDGAFLLTSGRVHHDRASLGGGSNFDEFSTNAGESIVRLAVASNGGKDGSTPRGTVRRLDRRVFGRLITIELNRISRRELMKGAAVAPTRKGRGASMAQLPPRGFRAFEEIAGRTGFGSGSRSFGSSGQLVRRITVAAEESAGGSTLVSSADRYSFQRPHCAPPSLSVTGRGGEKVVRLAS